MKANLGRIVAQSMTKAAEGRTIEVITGELLDAKQAGGEAILTIGRCLIEAKESLPHGEWLPWLNEKAEFSERTARNFMRLAREWSNPTALADLGASKALTLLALPAEEREQFMEDNNVIDMTTRQLEQAIKERDEARKAAEQAKEDASTAEQARTKMAEDMALLNARLNGAREDQEVAVASARKLAAELEELKNRPVSVAVETVVDQDAINKARAEAVAEMQAKLDKAKEAKKKAEEKAQEVQEALAQAQRKLEEQILAEKKASLGADKDIAQFEVFFSQVQETANKMRGLLLKARGREDQTAAQGMERALRALAEAIGGCAG